MELKYVIGFSVLFALVCVILTSVIITCRSRRRKKDDEFQLSSSDVTRSRMSWREGSKNSSQQFSKHKAHTSSSKWRSISELFCKFIRKKSHWKKQNCLKPLLAFLIGTLKFVFYQNLPTLSQNAFDLQGILKKNRFSHLSTTPLIFEHTTTLLPKCFFPAKPNTIANIFQNVVINKFNSWMIGSTR